jgi:hypothetical protein
VSLADLPNGTHWLLTAGDSEQRTLFSVTLPSEQPIIERRLQSATAWTSKSIDLKASVENVGDIGESILLEIRNQSKETLRVSEGDVQLQTEISIDPKPGEAPRTELMRCLSPRWRTADRKPFATMDIAPGQTKRLRVSGPNWLTKGIWASLEHETINEPALTPTQPGKLSVRVCLGNVSPPPVSVTSP